MDSGRLPQFTVITGDVALSPHDSGWQVCCDVTYIIIYNASNAVLFMYICCL